MLRGAGLGSFGWYAARRDGRRFARRVLGEVDQVGVADDLPTRAPCAVGLFVDEHPYRRASAWVIPGGLQAAITGCHASASSVRETDWERIVLLCEALGRVAPPSSRSTGPSRSRWRMDQSRHYLLWMNWSPPTACRGRTYSRACAGELLTRLGRTAEARAELELAARLCRNVRERTVLLRKAAALA